MTRSVGSGKVGLRMNSNSLKKAVGIITNNFGLKLLAIVVSCGLWFVVNNNIDPTEKKSYNNIKVEILNEDLLTNEGKVYDILDGTDTVSVEVYGKRSVLQYISKDDIKATADMSQLSFMNTISIEVSSARNNSELEFKTNIDNVKLSIEDRKRVQMIINTTTTGEPADGYIVGNITASQNIVRLSGPESVINSVDHVEAAVNIDGYSADINTSAELKLYDVDNNEIKNSSISMNISTVNMAVTILATKEVPLEFIVPDEPPEGYVITDEIISVPETITIAGRKSVLDGISKITVSDSALSVADNTKDMTTIVNITKYLPTGIQIADSSFNGNVSVTIGIEQIVTKELKIPSKNFAAGNIPDGFNVTLKEVDNEEPYVIKISGTQAVVDAVSANDVIGVVDMNMISDELGIEEWVSGNYIGKITFNLPDNVELDSDYSMTLVLEENTEDEENEKKNN
jgi:YbbR domain-containing protein